MAKNKLVFIFIVGSAIFLVGLMAFGRWWQEWQTDHSGPQATHTALAARAVNVSLTATAMMVAGAVRQTEVALTEEEQSLAATSTVMAAPTPTTSGGGRVTKEGLQLEVLEVNYDAWRLVKAQNQFNDPPWAGKHMILVKVKVTNVGGTGDEPLDISESDFQMVGERQNIYTSYSEESSCGVIPDRLDGVLLPGGSMSGNVCFQVPEREEGLQLIYSPFVGDEPDLYFDLFRK